MSTQTAGPRLILSPFRWIAFAVAAIMAAHPGQARVVDAICNFTPLSDTATLPSKLSETGLYDNVASPARKVTSDIRAFTVNAPLWSDGAHKSRWVQVPAGHSIRPIDTSLFDFPDKTVFIKNFAVDSIYNDSTSRILIETRFLVVSRSADTSDHETYISGITYRWRRNQSDADLVSPDGANVLIPTIWDKRRVGKRWRYPSQSNCVYCHAQRGVLGFIVPQLNDGKQLQALAAAGIISRDPLGGRKDGFRWYAYNDKSAAATLEKRARSYLAANCSHCHGNNNFPPGCDQSFEYLDPKKDPHYKLDDGYIGKPSTSEHFPQIVYPGRPDSSYLMRRLVSREVLMPSDFGLQLGGDVDQMPPLATFQIDSAAVPVMRDWICSLKPGKTCEAPQGNPDEYYWEVSLPLAASHRAPSVRAGFSALMVGHTLFIQGRAERVTMYDSRGGRVALEEIGAGRYRIGAQAAPGAYFVKSGNRYVRVALLP